MKTTSVLLLLLCLLICPFTEAQSVKDDYLKLVDDINTKRDSFAVIYENANSTVKKTIITKARSYLYKTITSKVFPYWYGTQWDFKQKGMLTSSCFSLAPSI